MLARWRTFLLFQVWMAWQGGFFFYAAVVVPIGTDVLGYHVLLGWCLMAERGTRFWRLRVGIGVVSAGLLVALFVLHPILDSFLDPVSQLVDRPKVFYQWHNAYLWISTVQWVLAVVQAWLIVGVWQGGRDAGRDAPLLDGKPVETF